MAVDESRALFSEQLRRFLRPARDAARDEDPRTSSVFLTRAQYERACAAIGVEPASDEECSPRDVGREELRAAAAATLRLERAEAIALESRQERDELQSRYPDGVDRPTYEALCAQAGIEPADDADIDALNREFYAAGIEVLPAMRLELARLRRSGMMRELNPWAPAPHSQGGGIAGSPATITEILTTAVVTAALVPFVQAIATKAGEDVYRAARRLLPRLLPCREERPHVRTIEVVDPDTRTRLRLDVDLPREAVERLAEVDASTVQASDRLIYWDRSVASGRLGDSQSGNGCGSGSRLTSAPSPRSWSTKSG